MEPESTRRPSPELLLRYVRSQATDAERQAVEACMAGDEEFRTIVAQMRSAEALAGDIFRMESFDSEAGYRRVRTRIRARGFERLRRRAVQWAAVLMLPLLVCSGVMSYLYYRERTPEELFAELSTPAGAVIRYDPRLREQAGVVKK